MFLRMVISGNNRFWSGSVFAHYMDVTNGPTFLRRKSADGQYIWSSKFWHSLANSVSRRNGSGWGTTALIAGSFYGTKRIWLPVLQSTWFRQHKLMYSLPSIAGGMGIWFVQKRWFHSAGSYWCNMWRQGTETFCLRFFLFSNKCWS